MKGLSLSEWLTDDKPVLCFGMDVFEFNLRHLRALAAVRDLGGISAAAASVNLSQPAVTQAIAKIEAQAGVRMFERHPSGMTATDAGHLLAGRVDAAVVALAEGWRAIKGAADADRLVTMAQVRALLALADAGSYVGAAEAAGLSQPSIHRAVADLERLCGCDLANRHGRGVALTRGGTRLARAFRLAVKELEAALHELAILGGRDSGAVRIGAAAPAITRMVPLAAARFHAQHAAVAIEICEGSQASLISKLRDGSLDCVVGPLEKAAQGVDLVQEVLFEEAIAVVARADHPLAGKGQPGLARLASFPWAVGAEGTPLREQWRRMFLNGGLYPPEAPICCASVAAIRALIAQSDFLALLSPEEVRLELESGLLATVGQPLGETSRSIGLATRKDWYPTPAQATFLDELRAAIPEATIQETEYLGTQFDLRA